MADRQPPTDRRKAFLVLGIIAAIAVLCWVVALRMGADARIQDCVMAGGRNCAPIEEGNR